MDDRGCHLRPCGEALMRLGVPALLVARVVQKRTVVVSFDTETTGLQDEDRVYQIAARAEIDGKMHDFMRILYFPRSDREFHPEATRKTGMNHEKLLDLHNRGETVTPEQGFQDFFDYLRGFPCGVVLAACNFTFDLPHVAYELEVILGKRAADTFRAAGVETFYDPQRLAKSKLRSYFRGSFRQGHMYRVVTGTFLENAHEAMADARALHILAHAEVFRARARWTKGCTWYKHGLDFIQAMCNKTTRDINKRRGSKRKAS